MRSIIVAATLAISVGNIANGADAAFSIKRGAVPKPATRKAAITAPAIPAAPSALPAPPPITKWLGIWARSDGKTLKLTDFDGSLFASGEGAEMWFGCPMILGKNGFYSDQTIAFSADGLSVILRHSGGCTGNGQQDVNVLCQLAEPDRIECSSAGRAPLVYTRKSF